MIFNLLGIICISVSQSCNRENCITNQMDYNRELLADGSQFNIISYAFWYKYHVFSRDHELTFNLFSERLDFQLQPDYAFTIAISNDSAIHEFVYLNSTSWDQQLKVQLQDDQDVWHFFLMYYRNEQLNLIIWFKDQIFTGFNDKYHLNSIFIEYLPYYSNIFIMMCTQLINTDLSYVTKIDYIPLLSKCSNLLQNNITVEYKPELLQYYLSKFEVNNALIYIWLKDLSTDAKLALNIYIQSDWVEEILRLDKNGRQLNLSVQQWNRTYQIRNQVILSNQELLQWYFLKLDYLQQSFLIIQTIIQEYKITFDNFDSYPEVQLNLIINKVMFSQFMITYLDLEFCPPNCQECSGMKCLKCNGNRIGSDCTCPLGQADFGLKSCECIYLHKQQDPYLKNSVQIINEEQTCPIGYLKCGQDAVLCDHNYIKFKDQCIECPILGTEVCRQCLVNNVLIQSELLCQYTNQMNLLRFKNYQIEDYMEFQYGGTLYIQNNQFSKIDQLSVTIYYQILNQSFQPIIRKKIKTTQLLCPYNYQPVFDLVNLQQYCIKLPKQCLQLGLKNLIYECVYCKEGYSLIKNICTKCPQQCLSCNKLKCTACFDGYYVSLDGSCKLCNIVNCLICYEYSNNQLSLTDDFNYQYSEQLCALCIQGFQYNYNRQQCQRKSLENCEISIYNGSHVCLVDSHESYNNLSKSCTILNCKQCYREICLVCQEGYYVDKFQCKLCRKMMTLSIQQVGTIICQQTDIFNYQHKKLNFQHIFRYHKKQFLDLSSFPLQTVNCLDDQILYDISFCQPINNQYTNSLLDYCNRYLLSTAGDPFCIEIQSNVSNFIINRITGQVAYCGGLKLCYRVINYEFQGQGKIEISNTLQYKNVQDFIEALNSTYLEKDQIEAVNIVYKSDPDIQSINNTHTNLKINLKLITTYSEIAQSRGSINIKNLNNLIISFMKGLCYNNLQAFNATIEQFRSGIYKVCPYSVSRHNLINSTILNINTIHLDQNSNREELFLLQDQEIIQINKIVINHDCQDTIYFSIKSDKQLRFIINEFLISDSNLTNCSLTTLAKNHHLKITNLTIKDSVMNSLFFINCFSADIEKILIQDSRIYNSEIFYSNGLLNFSDQIIIIKTEFQNSGIIIDRNSSYINSLQVLHCFMLNTHLIFSNGQQIIIKFLKLLEMTSTPGIQTQTLIHIKSTTTIIKEFFNYEYKGNSRVLIIYSKYIYLSRFQFKSYIEPYQIGEINDQCQVKLLNKKDNIFVQLEQYVLLELTDSHFKNIYTTEPFFIASTVETASKLLIRNLTFQNIQVFNAPLLTIQASNCSLDSIYFLDIWSHSFILDSFQIYYVFKVHSQTLSAVSLYFNNIKNINIDQFTWLQILSDTVHLRDLILVSSNLPTSHLIKYHLNQQKVHLDNAQGNFQLLQINALNITIQQIYIKNLTNMSSYLISVNSSKPIQSINLIDINLSGGQYFFKGLIQINNLVNYIYIKNIKALGLTIYGFLFDLKVQSRVVFSDLRITLWKNSGICKCHLLDSQTQLFIQNLQIHEIWKNTIQNFLIAESVLFNITNGQILLQNATFTRVIGDLLHFYNGVNLTLVNIALKNGQIINDLIIIKSIQVLTVKMLNLEIANYRFIHILREGNIIQKEIKIQSCWSGNYYFPEYSAYSFTGDQNSLISIIIDPEKESIIQLENIRIANNNNQQQLIRFQNVGSPIIMNMTIKGNICSQTCILLYWNNQNQISRQLGVDQFLQIMSSQFIRNNGILLDSAGLNIAFLSSIIKHKFDILKNNPQNQIFQLNDSLLISESRINKLVLNNSQYSKLFNDPYIMLSFDDGVSYYPTVNGTVTFNNRYFKKFEYCNFPTGQTLGEYQRLIFSKLQYTQFIKQMKFTMHGIDTHEDQQCKLEFQNQSLNFSLQAQDWKEFKIIQNPKDKSLIRMKVLCQESNLEFFIQILKCQLGEILLNDQCIRCPVDKYSVERNAVKCKHINDFINETQSGLIQLKSGHWRPYFINDNIEQCYNDNCLGGWDVGNRICKTGHIGALCQECDLYSIRGDGKYSKKHSGECQVCSNSYYGYIQFILILFLQFVLLHSAQVSWIANNQRMRNIRLFKSKQFMRLYKYQIDQIQNLNEICNNFIQIFLIIEESSDAIPYLLKHLLEYYSNPSINMQGIFQCYLTDYLTQDQLLYSKSLVSVVLYIIFCNLQIFKYQLQIGIRKMQYQFKLLLLVINQILLRNLTNFAEILIKQLTWSTISDIKWVNGDKSFEYSTQTHYLYLISIISPQAITIFIVLPIIYYKLLNRDYIQLISTQFFAKWGYCYQNYRQGFQHWFLVIILVRILMILTINISNSQNMYIILILILILFNYSLQINEPYLFKKYNKLILSLIYILIILVIQFGILNYSQRNQSRLVLIIQFIIAALLGYAFHIIFTDFKSILKPQIINIFDKMKDAKFIKQISLHNYIEKVLENHQERIFRVQGTLRKMKTKTIFSARVIRNPEVIECSFNQDLWKSTSLLHQFKQINVSRNQESEGSTNQQNASSKSDN